VDRKWETPIEGTPCATVIHTADLVHVPDRLLELYPKARDAKALHLVSYLGIPLKNGEGRIVGHLAVVDRRAMPNEPKARALFQIFAERAGAELRRVHAEAELREREEKLSRVVNGAMDAIIELDEDLAVTLLNPAAEKVLECESRRAEGLEFCDFLAPESGERLAKLAAELLSNGRPSAWIAGGLDATRLGGDKFTAEATLSCFRAERRHFFVLVLRNVNDRLDAERRIHSLEIEAECLREELHELQGAGNSGSKQEVARRHGRSPAGGRDGCNGADPGRNGHGQRAVCAGDSRGKPAA
jgi:PAS domain S-box-containing protein